MTKKEDEWKLTLSPDQYKVLRECGTEQPFTGKYINHKENGVYICAGCGNELFASNTKFESGSGWPSFWDQVSEDSIERREDHSHGMKRIEIVCKKCSGHLGHIFDDGPNPTGLRYCVNSLSLDFKSEEKE